MADEVSLSGQLTDLSEQAAVLHRTSLYGIQSPFTLDTRVSLGNVILEAEMLLSGNPQFHLLLHRLSTLRAHPEPQYLAISETLRLAAKFASTTFISTSAMQASTAVVPDYVDKIRIAGIRDAGARSKLDVSRLVRLCEELNSSFAYGNLMACAMLLRAIKDHCPPIFGQNNFASVVAHIPGTAANSTKKQLQRLEQSLKDVADKHLHNHISVHENLPTLAQIISFQPDLDALMGEITRALKTAQNS